MATECNKQKRYVVQFQGNDSKRWDWKEVWVDASVLDELRTVYDEAELVGNSAVEIQRKNYPLEGYFC